MLKKPTDALPFEGNPHGKFLGYTVKLADDSVVTYAWYRFVDQPSFQQYNWSEAKKARLQAFVENVTCVETRDFFRVREQSPTGASYHWNSNAETYFLIGDAMARRLIPKT